MVTDSHPSRLGRLLLCLSLLGLGAGALALPPLQLFVTLTPAGGTLKPEPGRYSGPVVIDKPLILDGGGEVIIDGGGAGTVLTITADGVAVRGLHLTRSGSSHDGVDAGILVKADGVTVEDNRIDQALFGIHLSSASDTVVRNNRISSFESLDSTLRGDAIRLWYSHGNRIEGNRIQHTRDLVFSNSSDNRIIGNHISHSRQGMELVYSPRNQIRGNTICHNTSGIAVIYSDDLSLTGNRILHLRKLTGSGISVKESYNILIADNKIAHSALGILATAPLEPENILKIKENLFTYNDVALYFYGEKGGHLIEGNRFVDNFVDVMGSAPPTTRLNRWLGNYWDRYQGFDLDRDGRGDLPHRVFLYSDRIWMERSMARFYRGSVALSLVDFIERLLPTSDPDLIYTDQEPLMANDRSQDRTAESVCKAFD